MSNVPAGSGRVPYAALIAFVVLALAGFVLAYFFYTDAVNFEMDLTAEIAKEKGEKEKGNEQQTGLDDFLSAIGFSMNPVTAEEQIRAVLAQNGYTVPAKEAVTRDDGAEVPKLETMLKAKHTVKQGIIGAIGFDPSAIDVEGKSPALDDAINKAWQDQEITGEALKGKVRAIVAQHVRAAKAQSEREAILQAGRNAVADLDRQIAAKRVESERQIAALDTRVDNMWKERDAEQNKCLTEPIKWTAEEKVLVVKLTLEQAIRVKLIAKQKLQNDMNTPVDGSIIEYDWRTKRGVINLGAEDGVKGGYEFDIYDRRPGTGRPDKRHYHGRLRCLDVYPRTSLFTLVACEWDDEENHPVRSGDMVCSQLYDRLKLRKFAVKGWFPEGGAYSKDALKGMIVKRGAILKEDVELDTDYLVLGIFSEEGLSNLSTEAKKGIADGAKAYKNARHWKVTVLTSEKFFKYMDRKGGKTSP